jgi:maleylacetate reductase
VTLAFTYTALPARVVFAEGALAQLDAEVARLGCTRPFVIAGAHHALAAKVAAVGMFGDAAMHTPVDVTERALAEVRSANADCLIAIGGGSAIGLAKAIALRTDLPQIVVPTTYAGSEATPILGQTEHGKKTTIRDLRVLPEVIVYDVALSSTLPRALTVTSGLNAMAHAVEAMYSPDANPVITAFAEQALTALAHALPILVEDVSDRDARAEALFGAWTAGMCLGSVGMALHHKLCHTLGGSFDLPHSETHAVVLPYAVAYNAVATDAMARIARSIGAVDAAGGLRALATKLGAPLSLRELGMPEAGLDRAAELATAAPYPNPRPIEREPIRELLGKAWAGEWPL